MDYEYTGDIEQTRNLLLPILRRARQTEPYKGHCKMEDDRVVIWGRTYSLNNLHQLPEDLNCFKVTSKQNDLCVGFFGGLNLLCNFHQASFRLDGIDYISAEQFIQAKKAEYFNDKNAYDHIMGCATSLDCKKNLRFIKGFDRNCWETHAKAICTPGIRAKFQQNVELMATLQLKTGAKRIVECTNDSFWGTGMPINKPDCLDQTKWTSQGILGEILEEIRQEGRSAVSHLPPHPSSTQLTQEIVRILNPYVPTNPNQGWNPPNSPAQIAMPFITPTNAPFNREALDPQKIPVTNSSLNGANNGANSVPEPQTSRVDHAEPPAVTVAVASSIVSIAHPITVNTISENVAGKGQEPSADHELIVGTANEVEMVEETH